MCVFLPARLAIAVDAPTVSGENTLLFLGIALLTTVKSLWGLFKGTKGSASISASFSGVKSEARVAKKSSLWEPGAVRRKLITYSKRGAGVAIGDGARDVLIVNGE